MTFSSIPGTKVEGEYKLLASCPLTPAYAHKHKHTHVHRGKGINVIVFLRILLLLFCEMETMMSKSPQTLSSVAFSQEEFIRGHTEYSRGRYNGSREQRWAHLGQSC